MRIQADGFVLRSLAATDAPAITRACQDSEIAYWLPHLPCPYEREDAVAFITRATAADEACQEYTLAVADADDLLLGVVTLRMREASATVGYWVAPEARGRGVATAATRALTRWGFQTQGLQRIELHAEQGNHGSLRVAERCGFVRREGELLEASGRALWVFELQRPAP